jgi:hypothetical protein
MKAFALLLIVALLGLLLWDLLRPRIREGVTACTAQQQDLAYQNAAAVQQCKANLADFEKEIDSKVASLQDQVNQFAIQINRNAGLIASNDSAIHASTSSISSSAKKKEAKLDSIAAKHNF